MYKSPQLCREEQAIVEHALNSLAYGIDKTDMVGDADADAKLQKMIKELEQKRAQQ